jgi:tRNA pseudouridine13 synthase
MTPLLITSDVPGIGGTIRAAPTDFVVEEIPAYEPCGAGEHLYVWMEKTGIGHEYLLRLIAEAVEIDRRDIGAAGMKDRHAVTRQWLSIPAKAEPLLARIDRPDLRVIRASRHTNKLRPGHLRGNRFAIRIRQVEKRPDDVDRIAERIRRLGLPNYFGEQRFGRDGSTLETGLRLIRGERLPHRPSPFLRKLALSAVQSHLFNDYLSRRLTDGLFRTVLPGDVLAKWPVGGMFVSTDPGTDQPRLEAREVVTAGPMFGSKTFPAAGIAAEREAAVLNDAGLSAASFSGFGQLVQGTRRHNFVYVNDLTTAWEDDALLLSFTLPAGSYATVLLREFMKSTVAGDDAADDMDA